MVDGDICSAVTNISSRVKHTPKEMNRSDSMSIKIEDITDFAFGLSSFYV
jgi:hypothetical protein